MFDSFRYLTHDLTVTLLNFILTLFFREIRVRGSHRIPEGPVIFVVAPHANQFVDPLLVMRECGRRTSFLIAEKSMHERGIGTFARNLNAIPVIRPQDLITKSTGTIQILDPIHNPLHITGTHTKFTSEYCPLDTIILTTSNEYRAQVEQVISDTELILRKPFDNKSTAIDLLTAGSCTFKCMPHVEQTAVYKSVHDELYRGGCITIFPEGGSHDRMEMLPLKAGVTLMALGAMEKYSPKLDVKIVPVGLNYFHAHKFRSRAVVEFGSPITVPKHYVDMYANGGEEKKLACGKLLNTIYDALKSVTLNAESYETLMLIQAARRLYKPAHRKLHISQVVDLNRRFLLGYNQFKDEPKVKELEQRVLAYNQQLKYYGICDHQVNKTRLSGSHTLLLVAKRFLVLLILVLMDFPGAFLNLPVIIIANVISQKKAKAALKGSTVKIAGRDVLATWKLLVGLVLIPSLYTFYSLLVFVFLTTTTFLDMRTIVSISVITWFMIAGVSYASLRSGEVGLDIVKSLKPMVMSAFDPSGAETLRHNREVLSSSITELINEYGPKAFPDFDVDYINRMEDPPTPTRSRSSSSIPSTSSSFVNLTNVNKLLPSPFNHLNQHTTKLLDSIHDHQLFNWGYNTNNGSSNILNGLVGNFFSKSSSSMSTPPALQYSSSRSSSSSSITEGQDPTDSISIEHVYNIKVY